MTGREHRTVVSKYYKRVRNSATSDYEAVGWGSAASQNKRFAVFNDFADLHGKTILDVGCGLGAFGEWLRSKGIKHTYYGCDITPEMVSGAREKLALQTIYNGSIEDFPKLSGVAYVDYVFASGIFWLDPVGGYDTIAYMAREMYEIARKGVAFNSLSSFSEKQEKSEFYANPSKVLEICQHITRSCVLRHDYHPADFSVYLRKEK